MPFFFCFLQYLISIFNDIQHRYSRFMSRKTVFRSTKTAIFENIGLLRRSTCCFLDLLHIFNDFFHLQTTNIVSFLSLWAAVEKAKLSWNIREVSVSRTPKVSTETPKVREFSVRKPWKKRGVRRLKSRVQTIDECALHVHIHVLVDKLNIWRTSVRSRDLGRFCMICLYIGLFSGLNCILNHEPWQQNARSCMINRQVFMT